MSDEKKPFKVSDRRHFTVEGEAREDAPEERQEPEPQPEPASASQAASSAKDSPKSPETAPGSRHDVDFGSFIISMAAQAGALLEGIPESEGGPAKPDLEGARSIISVLEMLRDKTQGRRTPEEDRIVEAVLYELRMGYVARARADKA
jgi:hypothetical protein